VYAVVPRVATKATQVTDMPDRDSIGAFVRQRRSANRMTQRQLAELAGVGLRFLSELERGKATVRVDAVDQVLRVFGKQLGVVDAPRPDEAL
jgi:y4mF family transcriptional regulator